MNPESEIWEDISLKLSEVLGTPAYESWVKPLRFNYIDDAVICVSTNSNNAKKWINKNYLEKINLVIRESTKQNLKLKIKVEDSQTVLQTKIDLPGINEKEGKQKNKSYEPKQNKNCPLSENQIDALKSISNNLNLKYTFNTFVIGENNKFAHAAAYAVSRHPGKTHNPLFIYGGVGLGKTHLMQSIGHFMLVNHPELKIKYSSAEAFTNELINCLRSDKMPLFRSKYRQMDVLLLDDIQFIEGKETTQEEIFHTFNTLHQMGKQLVLTSDRPPKHIPTLTERLRSRFEWGLIVDIQPPDIETRIAILKNKAEAENIEAPYEVLEMIANLYQKNIRELEGGLNRVAAYASINDSPLTAEIARKIIYSADSSKNLSTDRIIEAVANYFSIEAANIKGNSRTKEFSNARHIAIYLVRNLTNASFPNIGVSFGGRKHTTILYAYEKIKEEVQTNRTLAESASEISRRISAGEV